MRRYKVVGKVDGKDDRKIVKRLTVRALLHVWQEEAESRLWGFDVLMARETWSEKEQRLMQRERRGWKVVLRLMMGGIWWYRQSQLVSLV